METTYYIIIWVIAGIIGDLLTLTDKETRRAFHYVWPFHIGFILLGVLGLVISISFLFGETETKKSEIADLSKNTKISTCYLCGLSGIGILTDHRCIKIVDRNTRIVNGFKYSLSMVAKGIVKCENCVAFSDYSLCTSLGYECTEKKILCGEETLFNWQKVHE